MNADVQFPLDLPHRSARGGEDFFIAPGNREAVALVDRWPRWDHHAAILTGEAGAGKSHLAAIWRDKAGARILNATRLNPDDNLDDLAGTTILIEDADRMLSDNERRSALETGLFHLFNWLRETGGSLLMTARLPVSGWALSLPDLASRLAATPAFALGAADEELLQAVMIKLFSDRQMVVPPDVVRFASARLERSFAAVHAFVAALDTLSLAAKRPVTVPLARAAIDKSGDSGWAGHENDISCN